MKAIKKDNRCRENEHEDEKDLGEVVDLKVQEAGLRGRQLRVHLRPSLPTCVDDYPQYKTLRCQDSISPHGVLQR